MAQHRTQHKNTLSCWSALPTVCRSNPQQLVPVHSMSHQCSRPVAHSCQQGCPRPRSLSHTKEMIWLCPWWVNTNNHYLYGDNLVSWFLTPALKPVTVMPLDTRLWKLTLVSDRHISVSQEVLCNSLKARQPSARCWVWSFLGPMISTSALWAACWQHYIAVIFPFQQNHPLCWIPHWSSEIWFLLLRKSSLFLWAMVSLKLSVLSWNNMNYNCYSW